MELRGKVIVITGAAQGLGQKMSEILAGQGATLALVDVDHARLKDTIQLCNQAGAKVVDHPVDVTDEAAVVSMFDTVHKELGRVDGLINNAGITSDGLLVKAVDGKVQRKMSLAEFDKVIAVDLRGVFLCAREAATHMIEGGNGGVIVNISSISRAGNVGQTNYSAAKAGEIGFTKALALENAKGGITVNAICPGYINTEMVQAVPKEVLEKSILPLIPVGRLGEPEEIARAVVFLAADEAGAITGSTLSVNGGQYMM